MEPTVEHLIAAGKYAEAARIAQKNGDSRQAAKLYERVWEFGLASQCARQAGDLVWALENALLARDNSLVSELQEEIVQSGASGKRHVMEVLGKHRHYAQAALLAEEIDEIETAIDYHKRDHKDLEAARLLIALDRDHEAGRLLERAIDLGGDPSIVANAQLRLGQILSRRLQYEDAARLLQAAAQYKTTKHHAQIALTVALAALGYRIAAREILSQTRQEDPSLSEDLDVFLRNHHQPRRKHRPKVTVLAGRYRLEKMLGSGGAGQVYLANDEVTERNVAVKLFPSIESHNDPSYERFKREVRVASSLHHPNIVEVYDCSIDAGFLVMEHMSGGSLDNRIKEGSPKIVIFRLVIDLLAGLTCAHRRGIIHRDVKPANIFFDSRGTAKLGDFGIAHLLDLGQTQTGGLMGTLAYMAPEQITGAQLNVSTDLYGLGITLFETLTGRLPFLGPDFVAQHLGEIPATVSSLAPEHTRWDSIVARLLEKNPANRYQTTRDLRSEVEQIKQQRAPKPLVLPRVRVETSAERDQLATSKSAPVVATPSPDSPRYQFETPLGQTPISTLGRALDSVLDRSVIIERFTIPLHESVEQRIYSLARSGGPYMQRTLAYDVASAITVYEAPAGIPLSEAFAEHPLEITSAVDLLKALAQGLYPLHKTGAAHSGLSMASIVIDEYNHPTILVAGLGPLEPRSQADDIATILTMITGLLRTKQHAILGQTTPQPTNARELYEALNSDVKHV